jgi:hypothetical protein
LPRRQRKNAVCFAYPYRWTGRIGAALVIFIPLPLFSFFIAQLSSDLAMQQLRTRLHGPEDLPGKRVAGLPAAAYGGYKDAREAGAAGGLRLGAVPEEPREAWEAWVALMGADGHRLRAEAERLAWAGLQVRRETT